MRRAGLIAFVVMTSSIVFPTYANASTLYSFTTAGATGRSGPTQSQITTAYTGTPLAGAVTINTQGIQEWVVPASGSYLITARGASGGRGKAGNALANNPGYGARLTGTFALTAGTILRIVVGQDGQNQQNTDGGGGGGGGTFVVTSTGTILLIAGGGGGGGGRTNANGVNASLTSNGTTDATSKGTAGTAGGGGAPTATTWTGGGGGGFSGNGTGSGNAISSFGYSFTNGAAGGSAGASWPAQGGFGGGGGVSFGGGGGGGYSGGAGGDGGGDPYPGGGGGGSINNGTSTSAALLTSFGAGSLTIESLGPSLTTFAPRTTITNSTTIVYDVVFSEAVTGLAVGDFSLSGTGSSTCTIGSPSGSGTTYTVTLSGCSPGTVILTMAANAVTNTVPQTAPASNTAATTVTIDQTAPTISSVTPPANKTYFPSETATFTMNFSESITMTGTPILSLLVGSETRSVQMTTLADSRTALFVFTVPGSLTLFDTDGIEVVTTLNQNSAVIRDLASNNISNLTFPSVNTSSILVAQLPAAPTIDSITATSGTLTVFFTPGAARGSTTSNYQFSTNQGTSWSTRSPVATTSPLVISGLNNGQVYQVRLRAITNAGTSGASTTVNETPTAVAVTGDSTLTLTYGNSASTSSYAATGGTNTYTWSLGSVISGVTLSGTTVTASNTLAAGTYSQTVRATDGNSQVGTRSLTITVNKASTSISIALPNSATSAALGGAITITATVSRAGSVNFQLGGSTISGCGSASAASTTATCSWTPASLGSVSLTAIFTPTDSSNFETSTTTTLSITVVNGVSTVTLSLAGGATTVPKGQTINIIASIDQAGRVTFLIDGKRVPGCINRLASIGNISCSWKPAVQKAVVITANLNPTNNVYNNSSSRLAVQVTRRTGAR